MLLQCLAALLLLGDPPGLEGCQHSVQPQPLQALWARREAKCSERALRPPAQEDSGKPPGRGLGAADSTGARDPGFGKTVLALSLLLTEPRPAPSESARVSSELLSLSGEAHLVPARVHRGLWWTGAVGPPPGKWSGGWRTPVLLVGLKDNYRKKNGPVPATFWPGLPLCGDLCQGNQNERFLPHSFLLGLLPSARRP